MSRTLHKVLALLGIIVVLSLSVPATFARGGGGGSSGGGHSSGGGNGGYSSNHSSSGGGSSEMSCSSVNGCFKLFVVFFIIEYAILFPFWYKNLKKNYQEIETKRIFLGIVPLTVFFSLLSLFSIFASLLFTVFFAFNLIFTKFAPLPGTKISLVGIDKAYAIDISTIFLSFQKAWCEFDLATLKTLTTEPFYQQLVLELAVLKNEQRENRMDAIKLSSASVPKDTVSGSETLRVFVTASAKDSLYDTGLQKNLYTDSSSFQEFWNFINDSGEWKLDRIDQITENSSFVRQSIVDFAKRNNFFYNPDFGWLMLPNKGNLFSDASFVTSDVNDHVIGTYKNKIVEFYSIIFKRGGKEYFIGQAILPKSYGRIVIERKNKFSFFDRVPKGLKKMTFEGVSFNEEFLVSAESDDAVTAFELLHPVYMEYIMGLPYELNIEVVGNTVYFYTTSSKVDYQKLLEILSRAFDEIKE